MRALLSVAKEKFISPSRRPRDFAFADIARPCRIVTGAHRLLRGLTWRTVNITATVYIANECTIRLPQYIKALTRGSDSR